MMELAGKTGSTIITVKYVYAHVLFRKCQCGRFIRKSEGLGGGNGILYVNRRVLEIIFLTISTNNIIQKKNTKINQLSTPSWVN